MGSLKESSKGMSTNTNGLGVVSTIPLSTTFPNLSQRANPSLDHRPHKASRLVQGHRGFRWLVFLTGVTGLVAQLRTALSCAREATAVGLRGPTVLDDIVQAISGVADYFPR